MHDLTVSGTLENPTPAVWLCGLIVLGFLIAGIVIDLVLLRRFHAQRLDEHRLAARLTASPWSGDDARIVLGVMAAVGLVLFMALSTVHRMALLSPRNMTSLAVVAQVVVFHGTIGGLFFMRLRRRGWTWRRWLDPDGLALPTRLRQGAWLYLAMIPVVTAITWSWQALLQIAGFPIDPQFTVLLFTDEDTPRWLQLFLGAWAVFIAPPAEEMLFRGLALPLAARRFSLPVAVILVSLVFAGIHLHIPSFVPLFAVAGAFSLAAIGTGSLIPAIVMHAIFNAVNVAGVWWLAQHGMPS